MNPNAQALLDELMKVFDGGNVEYQFANSLHGYRLQHAGPTHWLYVAEEFIEDHTLAELLTSLYKLGIPEEFRGSRDSRWIFLGEEGVREVDDRFGRGL
jgi:hypothetical protein